MERDLLEELSVPGGNPGIYTLQGGWECPVCPILTIYNFNEPVDVYLVDKFFWPVDFR